MIPATNGYRYGLKEIKAGEYKGRTELVIRHTLEAEVDTICGSPLVGTVPQAFLLDQSTSLAVVSGDMYALKRTDHGNPP